MFLFKVDNVGCYASGEERNREVISLCNARFNFHTCNNVKLCGYYKVNTNLEIQNTEAVDVDNLTVDFFLYKLNPSLTCILHHLGVFFRDVVAGIVLFFALDFFLNVIIKFKELL